MKVTEHLSPSATVFVIGWLVIGCLLVIQSWPQAPSPPSAPVTGPADPVLGAPIGPSAPTDVQALIVDPVGRVYVHAINHASLAELLSALRRELRPEEVGVLGYVDPRGDAAALTWGDLHRAETEPTPHATECVVMRWMPVPAPWDRQ